MRHPDADMPERPVGVPDAVWSAVESVRSMPRVTYTILRVEIP